MAALFPLVQSPTRDERVVEAIVETHFQQATDEGLIHMLRLDQETIIRTQFTHTASSRPRV